MKVIFFDLINDGHHFFYNYNVMTSRNISEKYYFTSKMKENEKKKQLESGGVKVIETRVIKNGNILITLIQQFLVLFNLFKYILMININTAVLLYLDQFIIPFYFLHPIFPKRCNYIGTLHWFPNRSLKIKFLVKLCDKGLKLIVHTDELRERLYKIGIKEIEVIDYPAIETSNIDNFEARKKLNINLDEEKKTILYFGGTRLDKGLDILLEALKYVRSSVNIIIAGQEQYFKRDFIESEILKLNNKNIILNLNYIRDEDIEMYFKSSDIVVLPYRKMFNGESGILTEAINNKNIVVLPDIIHFPEIISKYSNGIIYEVESREDLGKKIDNVIDNFDYYKCGVLKAYCENKEKRSINRFIDSYEKAIIR